MFRPHPLGRRSGPGVGAGHGPWGSKGPGGHKQLRRAFKVARCLGAFWRATNGILQGRPLSVILVNVLTTMWKWEVDAPREQVCVATAALPPVAVAAKAHSESDEAS